MKNDLFNKTLLLKLTNRALIHIYIYIYISQLPSYE